MRTRLARHAARAAARGVTIIACIAVAGCALLPDDRTGAASGASTGTSTGTPTGASGPTPPNTATADDTLALRDLFDRHWAWIEQTYPEWSTYRGDHRFGDRLTDVGPVARAREDADERRWLAQAQALSTRGLSAQDRVSLDVFISDRRNAIVLQPFAGYRSMKIAALGGVQSDFSNLMQVTPASDRRQVDQLLARHAAFAKQIDDQIAHMREGIALGWVPPKSVLDRALKQIDGQLAPAIDKSPFLEPFTRLPTSVADDERRQWQSEARAAIERSVLPAMVKLRRFISNEYLAKAPADGSLMRYPDGAKVYAALAAFHSSTTLAPDEIHAVGLRELKRVRKQMEDVMRQAKFSGGFDRFVKWLDDDKRFGYADADALLAHYRDIGKRADAALPALFAELPRAPWGVKAMPDHFGPDHAEYYESPTDDTTRAGTFYANAAGWRKKRRWEAATLVAHEAVPGHHLQNARAIELRGLPSFRRHGGHTAYGEGWALYAETLGFDMGLYRDPYSRFGHLQWQAFRAARLVVDTGIHTQGWSRAKSIDFMIERTGVDRAFVTSEVDRYTSDPGQALAYMIGKLKIDELRDRAKRTLGPTFDIRRFHNAVLDQGSLPLGTLERVIDGWIEQEKLHRVGGGGS